MKCILSLVWSHAHITKSEIRKGQRKVKTSQELYNWFCYLVGVEAEHCLQLNQVVFVLYLTDK